MMGWLRRFLRREDGTSSVEFALTFPFVFYFFGLGTETAIYQMQQVMFERGVDIVVRDLRLGDTTLYDPDTLIQAVCDNALVVSGCVDDLNLEMETVNVTTYRGPDSSIDCVDRTETARPLISMTPGAGDSVMIMRFCLLIDPLFPNWGLGMVLPQVAGGGVPLYAQTFYVNEP